MQRVAAASGYATAVTKAERDGGGDGDLSCTRKGWADGGIKVLKRDGEKKENNSGGGEGGYTQHFNRAT